MNKFPLHVSPIQIAKIQQITCPTDCRNVDLHTYSMNLAPYPTSRICTINYFDLLPTRPSFTKTFTKCSMYCSNNFVILHNLLNLKQPSQCGYQCSLTKTVLQNQGDPQERKTLDNRPQRDVLSLPSGKILQNTNLQGSKYTNTAEY